MAITPTLMNETIAEYADQLFSSETPMLSALLEDAEKAGIPSISIGGLQGSFLQTLIRVMNAKTIVEIGSLAGYSALTMAMALPAGGKVICFELNEEYAAFIEKKALECGLEEKVTVISGPALDSLERWDPNTAIDMVFIDADKPNYTRYLELIIPYLRSGGIVIGDNALAWGFIADINPTFEPENVKGLQAFNDCLAHHDAFYKACLVPLGDGMAMAVKK